MNRDDVGDDVSLVSEDSSAGFSCRFSVSFGVADFPRGCKVCLLIVGGRSLNFQGGL